MNNIFEKISQLISQLYADFSWISVGLVLLLLLIAGIFTLFAKKDNSFDNALKWIVRIILVFAIILASPLLVKTVQDVFSDIVSFESLVGERPEGGTGGFVIRWLLWK